MQLRMFSVVGEALNFGARRMETIMRVAWLPVVLLLVLEMATVFASLSVANGRLITFADLAVGVSFERAAQAAQTALYTGLLQRSPQMIAIFATSLALHALLVASFMAPLIRFSGLGERPKPGVVKLAFGSDQLRFILASLVSLLFMAALIYAPIGATGYYVFKYIVETLSTVYASFPNPDSLHTIELVTAQDKLRESGEIWKYSYGLPLLAAAPFAIFFWFVLIAHFHPRNRAGDDHEPNLIARAGATLLGLVVAVGGVWLVLMGLANEETEKAYQYYFILIALIFVMFAFVSLRLFPYPGVAVCRKSLALGPTLRVSRGWNVARLFVIGFLVLATIFIVQVLVNSYVFGFVASTVNILYQATASATKLTNSGEISGWVLPFWTWVWTGFKILINIFLTFFFYGVIAGLLGRLYRESKVADDLTQVARQ